MIPRALLKKIRRIEIATNRMVNDYLAGQYLSVFKGHGMAFDEVRQYNLGDDIRDIDWNVSARMNDLYVKRFVEERELTVILLVDASGSEQFGSGAQSKAEIAAEISALLAFSAIKNNDRVGLVIFTDQVEKFIPPKKGAKHVLRVIMEILYFKPRNRKTNITCALEYLNTITKRKSVAFLISDFLTEGYEKPLNIMSRKHDLVPIQIIDPMEEHLPELGLLFLEDGETGEVIALDSTNRRVKKEFLSLAGLFRGKRETLFRKLRLDFITINTHKPYVKPLINFFKIRAKRY